MRFLRYALILCSLSASANLAAIQPNDIARVLDAPELSFSLSVDKGTVAESQDPSFVGGSALSVQPEYDEEHSNQHILIDLAIDATGPGVLTFKVRSENSQPHFFNVSNGSAYIQSSDLLPENPQPDQWYEVRASIEGHWDQVVLSMWPLGRPENSVFYFDDFEYKPGIELSVENIDEAGTLTLSPQKELYQVGEKIEVSVSPNQSFYVTSVSEIDPSTYKTIERPTSFTIEAERNLVLKPNYRQLLQLAGYQADLSLQDSEADLESDPSFIARSITIKGVPANTLLTFEAEMLQYREVTVSGHQMIYPSNPPVNSTYQDSGYETFSVFVAHPEDELTIDVGTHRLSPDKHYLPFRNFNLTQDKELAITTKGLGSVKVDYQPGPTPGTVTANLVASPEPGWEFHQWTGIAHSTEAETSLVIDAPGPLTAHFAQVFSFGESDWAFLHDGQTPITLANDGQGIRIGTNDQQTIVTLDLSLPKGGKFNATSYVYEGDSDTLSQSAPIFHETFRDATHPRAAQTEFYFPNENVTIIRDIIVTGGSGYNDLEVNLLAPEGSIASLPALEELEAGDTLKLSVSPDWQDEFVGWFGDAFSLEHELEIELSHPVEVSAVFEKTIPSKTGRSIQNRGTLILNQNASDEKIEFTPSTFAPGDWSQLDIELTSPVVVAIQLSDELALLNRTYSSPDGPLPNDEVEETYGPSLIYCALPDHQDGPLSIHFSNTKKRDLTGSIAIEGFYQDSNEWVPFEKTYWVKQTPDTRFHRIGSTVKIEAVPYRPDIQTFGMWLGREETSESFDLLVEEGETVFLSPTFTSPFPIDGVSDTTASDSNWQSGSSSTFTNTSNYDADEEQSISLQVQAPGVLFIKRKSFDTDLLDFEVFVDGKPARFGNYKLSLEDDLEILVGKGQGHVEIVTSLSDTAISSGTQPGASQIEILEYVPGFAVSGQADLPYPAHDWDASHPPIFPEGTAFTAYGLNLPEGVFGEWLGDLEGQPASVPLAIDRHIIANAIEKRARQIGPMTITAPDNAIIQTTEDPHSINYYIESKSGSSTFVIDIPIQTEVGLSVSNGDNIVRVEANGELIYEGWQSPLQLTFPLKDQSQRIELTLELDPNSNEQANFSVTASQDFGLAGDFGNQQEYVIPDPHKERYQPGEKVEIYLGNGAPSDHVFYEVAVAYPTLGTLEWLEVDGKRSFEIEMVSETILLGNVGTIPTRTNGQIITSRSVSTLSSSENAPDGRPTQTLGIPAWDSGSFFRIFAGDQKHVDFWVKPVEGTLLQLSDIIIDGIPLTISGNGEWQQLSIPAPSSTKYINVFIINQTDAESLPISQVHTSANYGIAFHSSGYGTIQSSPSNGVSAPNTPIKLNALAADGYTFASWHGADSEDSAELVATPNDSPFLFPYFRKNPPVLKVGEIEFTTDQAEVLNNPERIVFSSLGSRATATIEGPGRLLFSVESTNYGTLKTFLDGQEFEWIDQHPSQTQPQTPEILIPAGAHVLEFELHSNRNNSGATLSQLAFEKGTYIWSDPFPRNGSITIAPNKEFFAIGEQVTLSAQADYQYSFGSWNGDLAQAPQRSPYTFSPETHTLVEATFVHEAQFSKDYINWSVSTNPDNSTKNLAKAHLDGPGYLKISENIADAPAFLAKIDGIKSATYKDNYTHYLPIPEGKHTIELESYLHAPSFEAGLDYEPGLLVLLTGGSDSLRVDPQRPSYLPGSEISIRPTFTSSTDYNTVYQVGTQRLLTNETLNLTVSDHLILPVSQLTRIHATDFYLSGTPTPSSLKTSPGINGPSFTVPDLTVFSTSLHKTYTGPGRLGFTLRGLQHHIVTLRIDGEVANVFSDDQTASARIPPGEVAVEWEFSLASQSITATQPTISEITFAEESLSDYELWLARSIPAHLFARGIELGPDSDLDLDGLANQEERTLQTLPHVFNLPARIIPHSQSQISLSFEIPDWGNHAPARILALVEDGELAYWESIPLSSIDNLQTSSTDNGRIRVDVPREELPPTSTLFKIAVDLDN